MDYNRMTGYHSYQRVLLKKNFKPKDLLKFFNNSTKDQREYSMIEACEKGHVGIIKMLVNLGVDVNLITYPDETPLLVTCIKHNQFLSFKVLLESGADINACSGAARKSKFIMAALLENGANVQALKK